MIDGLDSVYTEIASNTLQVVLKALSNYKHIYVVNLSDSYAALKARTRRQEEAESKVYAPVHTHAQVYIITKVIM